MPEQKPSEPAPAFAHVHASPSALVPPPLVPLVPPLVPLVPPLVPESFGQSVSKLTAMSCEHGCPSMHESWLSVVDAHRLEQLFIASAAGSPQEVAFFWQRVLQSATDTGVDPELPDVPPDVPLDDPVVVLLHAALAMAATITKPRVVRIAAVCGSRGAVAIMKLEACRPSGALLDAAP